MAKSSPTATEAHAEAAKPHAPVDSQDSAANSANRRKYFRLFAIVALVIGIIVLILTLIFSGGSISTDDAYVGGDVASVTPLVNGAVTAVYATDTQQVKQGDALVQIDPADAKVALEQADAEMQQAIRKVKGYDATDFGLRAQQHAKQAEASKSHAEIDQAQSALVKAKGDLARRLAAGGDGAVSGEEVAKARDALDQAQASLKAAIATYNEAKANESVAAGNRAANQVLISGTSVDQNPEVAAARAKRDAAQLDLDRTVLRAPFDGVVAKRQVQVGQRVQAGGVLMTIVPSNKLYVDANFKENQLRKVLPGQAVKLTSDRYGSGVVYHGKVVGFAGGTGSAFALIPAQNATGNWIKVVQRVPLRIALDPKELQEHPLLVGLSMNATVDFH